MQSYLAYKRLKCLCIPITQVLRYQRVNQMSQFDQHTIQIDKTKGQRDKQCMVDKILHRTPMIEQQEPHLNGVNPGAPE